MPARAALVMQAMLYTPRLCITKIHIPFMHDKKFSFGNLASQTIAALGVGAFLTVIDSSFGVHQLPQVDRIDWMYEGAVEYGGVRIEIVKVEIIICNAKKRYQLEPSLQVAHDKFWQHGNPICHAV